jgi:hypothetical protein
LIATINSAEKRDGVLTELTEKSHRGTRYTVRNFRAGTKPAETYALIGKDTFAWSNSEALVQGAIDRLDNKTGLGHATRFRPVRDALSKKSLASVFVDPRFLEAAHSQTPTNRKGGDQDVPALLRRAFAAVSYAGFALEFRDGFFLHAHELIDPTKLDEPLRRWAASTSKADQLSVRMPPSALALAAAQIDGQAIFDEIMSLVPQSGRTRAENLTTALRGLLLNQDPRTAILPNIGPGAVVMIQESNEGSSADPAAVLLVLALADRPGVAEALDNAIRTVLALSALDPKRDPAGSLRVESRTIDGVRVTSLVGGKSTVSYALGSGALVLGTSPDLVAAQAAGKRASSDAQFERIRAEWFAHAATFAYADLERLRRFADVHRVALVHHIASKRGRPEAEARGDLEHALALLGCFRAVYLTHSVEAGLSWSHQTFGIISRAKP